MKKVILSFLFLSLSISLFSQKYVDTLYNFKVDNGNLIWQKVYKTNLNNSKIKNQLSKKGIELNNNQFKINYSTNNFKAYGYSVWSFPTYLNGDSFCKGIIEFKENKYRITIHSINTSSLNPMTDDMETNNISTYIVSKNKIKNKKHVKKVLNVFNKYFNHKLKPSENTEDDW